MEKWVENSFQRLFWNELMVGRMESITGREKVHELVGRKQPGCRLFVCEVQSH